AGATEQTIVPLMVGRAVEHLFPPRDRVLGAVVLDADGLESADGFVSVARFTVRAGEIVGIAGLDGSGRSTLAQLLAGVARARGGVHVSGRRMRGGPGGALRDGVAYAPPDRLRQGTVPTFTVGRSITYASLPRFTGLGLVSRRRERAAAA